MQTLEDAVVEWAAPGPGPWQQDSAHNPHGQTAALQQLMPAAFGRGFAETFARYGLLLDRLAMGTSNGFSYHQPQPFDLPGPTGPLTPQQIGAEVGRRAALAEAAFAGKLWREDLELWDSTCKPAAIRRHRQLGDVELTRLDDLALIEHLRACAAHLEAMAYQHHRFNMAALLPVGDFLVQVGTLLRRPPSALMGVLDGYSPVSGVVPPEMAAASAALGRDGDAAALLEGGGDEAERLDRLRQRVPEVDAYVRAVELRPVEGFDVLCPTLRERPDIVLGRLRAAMRADPGAAVRRADELADRLRSELPEGERSRFDELLTEARLVYRLRDERGLYSDIPAIGLLRLALLEVGRRAYAAGRLRQPDDALDVTIDEAVALLVGTPDAPAPDEVTMRIERRRRLDEAGAPRFLGPPPPAPPPVDQLPPALGRVMAAAGVVIEGVLGQLEEPAGTGQLIAGIPASAGIYEGLARVVHDPEDLFDLEDGDVLVAAAPGEAVNAVLHLLGAIVTDHGSFACHAGIVARETGFPAVVGTVNATRRIPDRARVRVDGTAGVVTLLE